MGKKKEISGSVTKGSGKQFKKKGEKKGKAGKVIGIIAAILATVIVLGVVIGYKLIDGGIIQRNTVAAESENFSVSAAEMTYFFNNYYQNYIQSMGSYLESLGLDTSKPLSDQDYTEGKSWYDYMMEQSKASVEQLLVLNEAAKADKDFDMADEIEAEVSETIESIKSAAEGYGVGFDYYLSHVFGANVSEKVLRSSLILSETASHYSSYLTDKYEFTDAERDTYFTENKDSFIKVDYLSYKFEITKTDVADDADEEAKAAAEEADTAAYNANVVLAEELAAVKTDEEFKAYIENYLKTVKFADSEEDKTEEIAETVENCLTTGATNSDTDLNKWLFAEERTAFETYTEKNDSGKTVTVYMILAADSDIDAGCAYRDTYNLKDFYYIKADSEEQAKAILAEYQDDATEEKFAALCEDEQYGGAHSEVGDKTSVSTEVGAWLFDSARKAGDAEVIKSEVAGENSITTSYYVVYYKGEGAVKWQYIADNGLANNKYTEDYTALEDLYKIDFHKKGLNMVSEISLSSK